MKKLEKLSNEVFATLEKSEMNQVFWGKNSSATACTNCESTTPDTTNWIDGTLPNGNNDGKWISVQ